MLGQCGQEKSVLMSWDKQETMERHLTWLRATKMLLRKNFGTDSRKKAGVGIGQICNLTQSSLL